MRKTRAIKWFAEPESHDFPAAQSYLGLIVDERTAKSIVSKLRKTRTVSFKAKDIFRASSLPMLPLSNSHVKKDEKRIISRQALSPLLLVRDATHGKVIVADGYHRLCAAYAFDEDVVIPCRIV